MLGANPRRIVEGVSDYEALIFLFKQSFHRDIVVKNIPNLHAKVVISDQKRAILSSSNLTYEGLKNNIAIGLEINGEIARELHRLVKEYWDATEEFKFRARAR